MYETDLVGRQCGCFGCSNGRHGHRHRVEDNLGETHRNNPQAKRPLGGNTGDEQE